MSNYENQKEDPASAAKRALVGGTLAGGMATTAVLVDYNTKYNKSRLSEALAGRFKQHIVDSKAGVKSLKGYKLNATVQKLKEAMANSKINQVKALAKKVPLAAAAGAAFGALTAKAHNDSIKRGY